MTPVSSDHRSVSCEPAAGDESVVWAALSRFEAAEPKLVFVFDRASHRFLKLDGPCEDFFNLTREELLANPYGWARSLEAFDRASVNTLQEDLTRCGKIVRQVRVIGRDGGKRTLRGVLVLHHEQGRVVVVGSVTDISVESAGGEPSSVLRSAMEEAHEGISVTDAEGNFLYLNREHLALFGYETMEDLIGKSWRVFYPAEVVRQIEQEVFPELVAKGRWRGLLQAKRKDGSLFLEALSLSLQGSGGIVCNCQDVSAQARLSERLEKSEAMFRLFLNTLPTGVIIRSLTGHVEFVNDATASFFGREVDPLGQSKSMEVRLSDHKKFGYWAVVARRVATTGAAERFDFPIVWGGREWVLDVEKRPLRIGSGDVTHICTLVNDVTTARRMEAQLADTARRRDEYLVMQREFISMVSHEFRTPLTAIQGVHYLMSQSFAGAAGPSVGNFERWLDLQGQALGTLRELVDQVLLLNRIEHLSSSLPEQVELGPLLKKLVKGTAIAPVNQRLKIVLNTPPGFTALVHECHLRALVENLVSNSLKYSTGIVSVHVGADENEWWLTVTDGGRGIPQKDQAKLFTPFFRAGNIGTVAGTGLGLTIVQRCASFHGGKVELESQEGKGATFTAKFPREFPVQGPMLPFTDRVPSANSFSELTPPIL